MSINWEAFENHPFYDELITSKGNARSYARKLIGYLKRKHLELRERGKRMEVATHFIHPDEISPQSLQIITDLIGTALDELEAMEDVPLAGNDPKPCYEPGDTAFNETGWDEAKIESAIVVSTFLARDSGVGLSS